MTGTLPEIECMINTGESLELVGHLNAGNLMAEDIETNVGNKVCT